MTGNGGAPAGANIPAAGWMNQMNMDNAVKVNQQHPPQQQQHHQQQQAVSTQQQMTNLSNNGGINQMSMTAQQQQQHLQQQQKLQMMQLHHHPKNNAMQQQKQKQPQQMQQQKQQPRGSWTQQLQQNTNNLQPIMGQINNNSSNGNTQNMNAMMHPQGSGAPIVVGQQTQQQPSQSQQMMQFQMQQQQMKQLQMHQTQQQQQQQQPQNQMMQQPQQHHTQHQMVQQQQLHQTQQMQALEEQKRRYSMQLQQLQTQQNIQAQQMTRPTSASSHQSLPQQQIAVQQQQQHHPMSRSNSISSQGADRRLSYRIDAETPLSPSMRPPSSRPTSTAPMRPPSRPNSQFSQASAQSLASSHQNVQVFPGGGQSNNSTGSEFPSNTFYNPVSTNRSNQSTSSVAQRGGESTSTPNSAQHVAFNTNVSTYSHPTLPPNSMQHTGHNKTQQLGTSTATKTTADVPSSKSAPNQLQSTTATSTAVSKSGGVRKTAPLRRHSQGTHTSTLTYEEVSNLAKSCTTEQKIVWVARQIFGSGGNGFQKATSAMQRMKRQRARSFKQKKGGGTSVKDVASDFQEAEEKLKLDTFDVRVAKKMQIEMKQGLQFCNLMTDVIGSILEDVDPENPILLVQPPMIGCDDAGLGSEADLFSALPLSLPSSGAVAVDNAGARSTQFSAGTKPGKSLGGRSGSNLPPSSTTPSLDATKGKISSGMKVPMSPSAARKNKAIPAGAEIMAEGNPNGSTLRKLRKRGSTTMPAADVELLKMVGDHDDNGKKLSKKELSYRLFEATRFRSLEVGDYVAAKMASHDLWILARVAKQWNAVATYKQLTGLTEAKRDAIFREKVYIQDNDEYNGDIKSARSVNRQHILPLPRSFSEASDWGFRIRKGFRVYAMYPNTTALYCGSVIDSNTYCRNQDE
eukprot:CAMPEP_0181099212 /NCGR_PEP_ID=MMETSP1071-20121207/12540_1 /TAXON_ID=35127 /ORGANISM="Thalassiosira sp., Strain NH16" /LENGTH=907 /DNA_ID=CAMNT_0023181861 /DNA_START=166 /DNA_END=2889 /DNA_ORIENTATION=-